MHICYSFQEANNKFADQTAHMRSRGWCVCGGGGDRGYSHFFLDM